jgi:hypothetical protein
MSFVAFAFAFAGAFAVTFSFAQRSVLVVV